MRRWSVCLSLLIGVLAFAAEKPNDTKVLVPVVVNPVGGHLVLDLKTADFSAEGPKDVKLESAQLVPAEALPDPQHTIPVFILYDAYFFPAPVQTIIGSQLLEFLGEVAQHPSPVTLVVNTTSGLKPVYDFGTDPKVLADALAVLNTGAKASDSKVKEQVDRLKILRTYIPAPSAVEDQSKLQFAGLTSIAQILGRSPNRKAVLWMTWNYWLGTGMYTTNWTLNTMAEQRSLSSVAGSRSEDLLANASDTRYGSVPPLYQKAISSLNTAHISVYALQLYNPNDPTFSLSDPNVRNTAEGLRQVAACTGGVNMKDFTQMKVGQAVSQVRADGGPYYMLTISAADIKKTDWVPIKVKVNRDGLSIRTAPGFLGLSPSAAKAAGISAK